MKYLLIFLSFFTMAHAEIEWVMTKCNAPLSYYVDFTYLKGEEVTGQAVRSGLFTPRYYYDLYSPEGTFLSRAINRVFSLGTFSPNLMEFNIYDSTNTYIGYIGGKLWTSGQAKFGFWNANGIELGSALLSSDSDQAIFSILSSSNLIVATLKGTLSGDLSKWELDVQKSHTIDPRILKIFAAFVADFHLEFIRKPEVIHNHYYFDPPKR